MCTHDELKRQAAATGVPYERLVVEAYGRMYMDVAAQIQDSEWMTPYRKMLALQRESEIHIPDDLRDRLNSLFDQA
ncbi:hypothetical protein ACFL0V_03580 [Nanoarchaeota archaeon]